MVDKLAWLYLDPFAACGPGPWPCTWSMAGPWALASLLIFQPSRFAFGLYSSFVFPSIMESCFEFSASLLRFVFNTFKFKEQQLGVLQAIIFLTAHPLLVNFSD